MKKREIKIVNFLYLDEKKYNKILEYRNQEYIRKVSINENIISKKEHKDYLELLKKKDKYFSFLITINKKDYGVISLKKITEDTYSIVDYLVKEEYKFEGGGIVNRICLSYIASKLNIKYLKSKQLIDNTRGNRLGGVKTIEVIRCENSDFNEIKAVVDNFYDESIINSKSRMLFDKLYDIKDCQI